MFVRRVAALLACATAFAVLPGTAAADPIDDARKRLNVLAARIQDAEAREGLLADKLTKLDRELRGTEKELAAVRERYAVRARAAYQTGLGGDTLVVMMSAENPGAVLERLDLLNAAFQGDEQLLRQGKVLRRRLNEQQTRLDEARREALGVARDMQKDRRDLQALLNRLEEQEAERIRRDAAARDAASRARSVVRALPRASRSAPSVARLSGSYSCPVGPNHAFRDTWGAPRSGGRSHKGTDIFAPYGAPAYAVVSGVVTRTSSSTNGGLGLYLRGNDGNEYYYAHMSRFTTSPGQRVNAGQEVAKVGDSGNARGTSPHIHFEVHPGGGYPVNPYPYVSRWC
ncbi:MAG TPA: peptidoglycan DD-metalloendopeptidase family protein [Frankiaceae bacterium]|nr:peptidoglycan DD-metalloendopeptidase family protein [Frankiaceae bacterium]